MAEKHVQESQDVTRRKARPKQAAHPGAKGQAAKGKKVKKAKTSKKKPAKKAKVARAKREPREKRPLFHRDMTRSEKVVSTLLFFAFVLFVYLSLPLSRIQSLTVVGNTDVTSEDILTSSQLKPNQLFFEAVFFPSRITEAIKKQYPKVDNVTYKLAENNQLLLTVSEHQVIGTVQDDNNPKVLLDNGTVLANYYSKYLGSVTDVSWQGSGESLETFAQEFAKVDEDLRKQVSSATYQSEDLLTVHLYMLDGNEILANYTDFASKMGYYPNLVSETDGKKGVFDFSVGIYFTPYR